MERSAKSTWGYDGRAIAPMSVAGLSTASLRSEESTQALKDSRRRTAKTAEKSARLAVRVGNVFNLCVHWRARRFLRAFGADKKTI